MNAVKKIIKITVRTLVISVLLLALVFAVGYAIIKKSIDYERDDELFRMAKGTSVTRFYADSGDGSEYAPIEIETTAFGAERKVWYSKDDVSDFLKKGFIAAEDREFYTHKGVNFRRTLGAALNYIFNTRDGYGASTITQQVVKNISGDNAPTPKRKLYEIFRALEMEKRHTKEEILELYLNIVPMSENIAGVGFAAEQYFGKEPNELTLAEAAAVVGITNSPKRYNPRQNPEACIKRRNTVLLAMLDMNFISKEEYEKACSEPLTLAPVSNKSYSSWFVETVISDVTSEFTKRYGISEAAARLKLMKGGYKIYTTENPNVQKTLEAFFENEENLPPEINDGLNYAMCVCDSQNGNLLGIIGRAGQRSAGGLLNLATVPHPPASTLKPLALYAPLINSGDINWSTIIEDTPTEVSERDGEYVLFPHNSPNVYQGPITVKDALRTSKNTVAVRLYKKLGARKIFDSLKRDFNFDTLVERAEGYSGTVSDLAPSPLALGQLSYGVPLRTLTEAYTVFPSEGTLTRGRSYVLITDDRDNTVIDNRPVKREVFSKETARLMNQLLMNVVADGTARKITLKDTVDTAGKTGTSQSNYDKLFVGYTPYYTAGIWCGYPDTNTPVERLSVSHLEIWDRVMNEIHKQKDCEEHFSTEGLITLDYCKDSGLLATDECLTDEGSGIERGWFLPDFCPQIPCPHSTAPSDNEREKSGGV